MVAYPSEDLGEPCPECGRGLLAYNRQIATGEIQTWVACIECGFALGCGTVPKVAGARAKCMRRLADWREGPEVYERRAWE